MTFLILRFSSVGNVAMTVPVVASLSRRYPQHRFVVVSKNRLSAMFYGMDNVLFHASDGMERGLIGMLRLWWHLRQYKVDAVIDLQDVLRTHILRFFYRLQGKAIYVVQSDRWLKRRITWHGYKGEQLPSETDRYRHTFAKAGLETDDSFTAIAVNTDAAKAVNKRFGEKKGIRIGVAPFAKHYSNMLPYRTLRQVIQQLSALDNTSFYLFGAGEIECEMLRQWSCLFPHTVSVAGELPLAEELELMRSLDLMLCMDSANQHIASVVGLPTLTIWLATHPALGFLGWKQQHTLQTTLPCRPCSVHGTSLCRCFNFACQQMEADTIVNKVKEILTDNE